MKPSKQTLASIRGERHHDMPEKPAAPQPSKAPPLGASAKDNEAIYQAVHKAHRQVQPAKAAQDYNVPIYATRRIEQLQAELERVKAEQLELNARWAQREHELQQQRDELLADMRIIAQTHLPEAHRIADKWIERGSHWCAWCPTDKEKAAAEASVASEPKVGRAS